MEGGIEQKMFFDTGIRAVQSTPLVSRHGKGLGMISTHWRKPHRPSQRDLRLFDILARQAADVIERKHDEDRAVLLLRELEHRSNNLLASVTAIARMTKAATHEGYVGALLGRIGALARVNKLMGQNRWGSMDIAHLITHELTPYGIGEAGRIRLRGPAHPVSGKVAQSLALVLHELAINAATYGALSLPTGNVAIDWTALPSGSLQIRWSEWGGPPVVTPSRQGFGSNLVETIVICDFRGGISFNWATAGLVCTFTVSIDVLCPVRGEGQREISH
jgi:two-component sensor histidine kinase